VVPGLAYIQNVKRGPMRVSKDSQMLGSYGPSTAVQTNKFATEDAPSGMLARATCKFQRAIRVFG
jgi:Rho GDP-dissociation inhibitor